MFELHPQLANDSILLGDLPLCRVLLINDAQFPWLILVPRRAQVTEIFQLAEIDRIQLQVEIHSVSVALMDFFCGDKLNIAALGNLVPQLHIHLVIRYHSDTAWPKPVWGNAPAKPYSAAERSKRVSQLKELLKL